MVLAEGLLRYRLKAELRDVYAEDRAALVSEFFPTDRWLAGRAMQRNKTICLLSKALVLVEARMKSGTHAAGEAALSMGLPLFTAEYSEEMEANAGNRDLLQRGARPLRASKSSGRANVVDLLSAIEKESPPTDPASQLQLIE